MKKKILVLIDCQNDFITGSLANPEAQKKVKNIVKKVEEFDGDAIIYTLDTHEENYLETEEGKKLPVVHCVRDTQGWELNPEISEALSNAVKREVTVDIIEKPTFGSFDLPLRVKEIVGEEPFDVDFVGFCTDICVVSNALILKAAAYQTANITVDSNCCAGVTPEKHEAALETMRSCQINVI
jgi:nicotinamidase-related amidase